MKKADAHSQNPANGNLGSTILIVEDDPLDQQTLQMICSMMDRNGKPRTLVAPDIPEALRVLASLPIDVVLLDKNIKSAGRNGINDIPEFLRLQPHLQVLVVTGSSEIDDVVHAMRLGAFSYVVKGGPSELLASQIKQAITVSKLTLEKIRGDREPRNPSVNLISGKSLAIAETRYKLEGVAESARPLLLVGDSGTGKTTAAKYVHDLRLKFLKESDCPFIALNMAAISESMAETELFGNEAGAFTDAKLARPGFIELANHGTLFLDEIGEASLELQAKLLKVIDEGRFYRLGGKKELTSQFRLICATNRDLKEMMDHKKFRRDLYMRISTFTVSMPDLSDRMDDVPEIIRGLLPRCCNENQVFITYEDLPKDFIEFCQNTTFEGNIRGLDQTISRLLVYAPKDRQRRPQLTGWKNILLPPSKRANGWHAGQLFMTLDALMKGTYDVVDETFPGLEAVLNAVTERIVSEALGKFPKQKDAARVLKVSPPNLTYKMKSLNLTRRG